MRSAENGVSTQTGSELQQLKLEIERLKNENLALKMRLGVEAGVVKTDAPASLPPEAEDVQPKHSDAMTEEEIAELLQDGIRWPERGEANFWERPPRTSPPPFELYDTGGGADVVHPRDRIALHIVHITAEMAPVAKVGGLGDVVTGLSKAVMDRGHNVEVILPFYESLETHRGTAVMTQPTLEMSFQCPKGRVWDGVMQLGELQTEVYRCEIDGVPVALIRPDWGQSNLFKGGKIYGGSYNEPEAYLYFCRAALEYLLRSGRNPNVLHIHEWQASAAALLYWDFFHGVGLTLCRVVLTIHNVGNSGEISQQEFSVTGVPGNLFATIDKALDERTIGHNPERLNLLKGGIIYSNAVTTVSPTYKVETLERGAAGWLATTLNRPDVRPKYSGILNGIDIEAWNPTADPTIPAPFSPEVLTTKALCKKYLQRGLGLAENPNAPLFVCITRLVPQKGIHMIARAIRKANESGAQFVLLGTGHADGEFKKMAEHEFRNSDRVKCLLFFSERLSHLLYAASDFTVVPSMFEPCGLTQMIAMRYGSVPVVRKTGGLADTVQDVDADAGEGNGFVFEGAGDHDMAVCMDRALRRYHQGGEGWKDLVRRNMKRDVSWGKSAAAYAKLYFEIGFD